ncbi:MAG: hypothetical protein JWP22_2213 [Ramlibacter sp.]|nr:hypothetical protein [Ramlibacter sp.]MDB5913538.1 hypothetical protein [Ramlibacter sp.]
MRIEHHAHRPDHLANQSVLGEEDPGAALDSMAPARREGAPRDAQAVDPSACPTCGAPGGSPEGDRTERASLLRRSISRWENEGGADGKPAPESLHSGHGQTDVLLTNAELVQLQIRVIALENLVTALLAGATDRTSDLARELAGYISPRAGFTPHHLTVHAAAQMVHLVERSSLFRGEPGAEDDRSRP